ncbi:hypothetical protein BGZ67_009867, partial [Mortierella alpina]
MQPSLFNAQRDGSLRTIRADQEQVGTWSENGSIYKSRHVYRPPRSKAGSEQRRLDDRYVYSPNSKRRRLDYKRWRLADRLHYNQRWIDCKHDYRDARLRRTGCGNNSGLWKSDDARRQRAEEQRRPPPEHLEQHPLRAEYRTAAVAVAVPRLAVATVGPVCMSPSDARAVERLWGAWADNKKPRTLSSDGALIKSGTAEIAMAFGVADLTQPELLTVQGRTDGYASSAKPELKGLLAAILSAPPDLDILVELDNESVVVQYQQLVRDRRDALPRKRQRSNYAGLWAVLHQVVLDRAGSTEVQWVRGHSDNAGNIVADRVATHALEEEDNHHLWSCGALDDVNTVIWEAALARIDGWGQTATVKYSARETQVEWACPSSSNNIQGLSSIAGARALLLGEGVPDCSPDPKWTVADLYRGITPHSLIQEWGNLFDTPKSIAQSVSYKFVRYLAEQATELIRKLRCTATVAWEREQAVTAAQKRA